MSLILRLMESRPEPFIAEFPLGVGYYFSLLQQFENSLEFKTSNKYDFYFAIFEFITA